MLDTDQIIARMDEGFSKLHSRLNDFAEQTKERQLGCLARFSNIEKTLAVTNGINKERSETRLDWAKVRQYVAGLVLGVIALAALKILFLGVGSYKW